MSLSTNLVAYWTFDESSGNATDSVSSIVLTNTNTVTYGAAKINNGANLAAASSQYLTTPGAAWNDLTSAYSFAGWVYFTTTPSSGGYMTIIAKHDNSSWSKTCFYLILINSSGTLKLNFLHGYSGTAGESVSVNWTPSTATLYHIAVVNDGSGNLKFYVDGAQQGSTQSLAHTSTTSNSSVAVEFGTDNNNPRNAFLNGRLDEWGIWSRALTSTEVSDLYNGGSGNQYPFTIAYTLTATTASFAITGIAASLLKASTIAAQTISFTLSGLATALLKASTLTAQTTSFTVTGISATLSKGYVMAAAVAAFTLSGTSVGLKRALQLTTVAGTFALTGITTTFTRALKLATSVGIFILTAFDFRIANYWTKSSLVDTNWTNKTRSSASWKNQKRDD